MATVALLLNLTNKESPFLPWWVLSMLPITCQTVPAVLMLYVE